MLLDHFQMKNGILLTIYFETVHFHHQQTHFAKLELLALFVEFWRKEYSDCSTSLHVFVIHHFYRVNEWSMLQVTKSEIMKFKKK